CHVYVVGGGEDLPQALAARQLGPGLDGALGQAVSDGACVLAVCAGMQILGRSFAGPDGSEVEGIGLIDCRTSEGRGPRAVGEIVVEPLPELALPVLSGYENHGGITSLGSGALPLGRVRHGSGNGDGSGVDGAWQGKVLGTYLHGPVLARNPALADLILSWAVGDLAPLDDRECEELRGERLAAAGAARRRRRLR
ncbi:MAG: glutamine amidotransferase, partial [Acidimicrobiales bacterium]|nr:glutamine amidotransferase [Acidimicrobiales bacterium]